MLEDKKEELVEDNSPGSRFVESVIESMGDFVGKEENEASVSESGSDAASLVPTDLGADTLSDSVSDSVSEAASDTVGEAVSNSVVESASNFIGSVFEGFFDSL